MASRMEIACYGVTLALAVFAGLLPAPTEGNVIDQRGFQRELGEISPDIMSSLNGKDEFRELGEPAAAAASSVAVNDYNNIVKTQAADDQNLENALVDYYLFVKEMMMRNKIRARTDSARRAHDKRSYWKQCAFNAVSCFG